MTTQKPIVCYRVTSTVEMMGTKHYGPYLTEEDAIKALQGFRRNFGGLIRYVEDTPKMVSLMTGGFNNKLVTWKVEPVEEGGW